MRLPSIINYIQSNNICFVFVFIWLLLLIFRQVKQINHILAFLILHRAHSTVQTHTHTVYTLYLALSYSRFINNTFDFLPFDCFSSIAIWHLYVFHCRPPTISRRMPSFCVSVSIHPKYICYMRGACVYRFRFRKQRGNESFSSVTSRCAEKVAGANCNSNSFCWGNDFQYFQWHPPQYTVPVYVGTERSFVLSSYLLRI